MMRAIILAAFVAGYGPRMCYAAHMIASDRLHHRTELARTFAQQWILSNVYKVPGTADTPLEIDRLASEMTSAARSLGISGSDIARAVGDIDDYLSGELEKLQKVPG